MAPPPLQALAPSRHRAGTLPSRRRVLKSGVGAGLGLGPVGSLPVVRNFATALQNAKKVA